MTEELKRGSCPYCGWPTLTILAQIVLRRKRKPVPERLKARAHDYYVRVTKPKIERRRLERRA